MSIREDNYAVIQGWMLSRLGLRGNELLIYAIIYGFSQEDGQVFSGSLRYLAEWTNSTKRSVMNNLNSLVEKGLIKKQEKIINGVKFCEYYATNFTTLVKKFHYPSEKISMGGMEKISPNNKDIDNIEDKLEIKKSAKRFSPPTIEEVRSYCKERNNSVDAEQFIDFYASKGWKVGNTPMKDWKAAVRTWEKRDFDRRKPHLSPQEEEYIKLSTGDDDLPF